MTESNHTVSDDDSAQLAIDVVKNHEDTNTRDKRNVHNITQKHIKPYIAGEVFVKEDKYMDFEIGTGNGTNVALDETKNYEVVVVTKTQSGAVISEVYLCFVQHISWFLILE
ncbi:hypothetical protein SK128_024314 [Halocaridina rubra]|uniref:Uncharacterized protein n=1 Tax=Halocaridina rubra TaxID=373956 RepID=A0AAN8XFB4_HALRR